MESADEQAFNKQLSYNKENLNPADYLDIPYTRELCSYLDTISHKKEEFSIENEIKAQDCNEFEIRQKSKTIKALKSALKNARKQRDDTTRIYEKKVAELSKVHQNTKDSSSKRQLQFIDKLVKDKKKLTLELKTISLRLRDVQNEHKLHIKRLTQTKSIELEKQRIIVEETANNKRKIWEEAKLKQIKQETIKNLEPEIQKLLTQQAKALKDKDQSFLLQLEAVKAEQLIVLKNSLDDLREELNVEKKASLEAQRKLLLTKKKQQFNMLKRKAKLSVKQIKQRYLSCSKSLRNKLKLNEEKLNTIERRLLLCKKTEIDQLTLNHKAKIEELKIDFSNVLEKNEQDFENKLNRAKEEHLSKLESNFLMEQEKRKAELLDSLKTEHIKIKNKLKTEAVAEVKEELALLEKKNEQLLCSLKEQKSLMDSCTLREEVEKKIINDQKLQLRELAFRLKKKINKIKVLKNQVAKFDTLQNQKIVLLNKKLEESEEDKKALDIKLNQALSNQSSIISKEKMACSEKVREVNLKMEDMSKNLHLKIQNMLRVKEDSIKMLKRKLRETSLKLEKTEEYVDRQREELLQ